MVISVAKVKAKVKELKQAATQKALALGVNPFEVDAKKIESSKIRHKETSCKSAFPC